MSLQKVICVFLIGTLEAGFLIRQSLAAEEITVTSPDARNVLHLEIKQGPAGLHYSVARDGRTVIDRSPIDVQISKGGSLADVAKFGAANRSTIDRTSPLDWGKTDKLREHCHTATIDITAASGAKWQLELRAYDDGVAWRYLIPKQREFSTIEINAEDSEFRVNDDPTMLLMSLKNYTTSHEASYEQAALSEVKTQRLYEMPVLATWPDGTAAAITEARLRGFAGMYLDCVESEAGKKRFVARLSPHPERENLAVVSEGSCVSPWRAFLLADSAGKLVENSLLLALNDPPDGDFSWAKPGKTTWPWWNGTIEHGPDSTPGVNFAVNKQYIDFCAANNIEYHAISSVSGDRPWYVQRDKGFSRPHADTDILTPRPDIDLPRILAYAKEKGVGIRLWVHWKPLSEHLDEAFSRYSDWGVKGLMVDFLNRDDQEMVEWEERCLEAAAKYKLHIQFHGSHKPTGEERTFPNLFNREGVLNLEYLKWTNRCDPQHSVNVAYTRSLAGPTDYHLGGFRAVSREKFQSRDEKPVVMGSRANQLGLYVVYENPMPMLADIPEAYEGQSGFDFLVEVPTSWDETRYVLGEVGEFLVVARRRGRDWYLGGINNWTPRNVSIPLTLLGAGEYDARVYCDTSLDGSEPNKMRIVERRVGPKDSLDVQLAPGGGVAAIVRARK